MSKESVDEGQLSLGFLRALSVEFVKKPSQLPAKRLGQSFRGFLGRDWPQSSTRRISQLGEHLGERFSNKPVIKPVSDVHRFNSPVSLGAVPTQPVDLGQGLIQLQLGRLFDEK